MFPQPRAADTSAAAVPPPPLTLKTVDGPRARGGVAWRMCSDAFPTVADDSESIFLTSWLFALREGGTDVGRALRTDPILLSTVARARLERERGAPCQRLTCGIGWLSLDQI